jgi:hypothetical protein
VNQLDHAIQFVQANPTKTAARSVIVYAWNELAEGGYIVPTLAAGSATLDAVAAYLGKPIPPATPSLAPVVMPAVSKLGHRLLRRATASGSSAPTSTPTATSSCRAATLRPGGGAGDLPRADARGPPRGSRAWRSAWQAPPSGQPSPRRAYACRW